MSEARETQALNKRVLERLHDAVSFFGDDVGSDR